MVSLVRSRVKILGTLPTTPSKKINRRLICLMLNFYLFPPSSPPAVLFFFHPWKYKNT
jgi:hypothetical protein